MNHGSFKEDVWDCVTVSVTDMMTAVNMKMTEMGIVGGDGVLIKSVYFLLSLSYLMSPNNLKEQQQRRLLA